MPEALIANPTHLISNYRQHWNSDLVNLQNHMLTYLLFLQFRSESNIVGGGEIIDTNVSSVVEF